MPLTHKIAFISKEKSNVAFYSSDSNSNVVNVFKYWKLNLFTDLFHKWFLVG